MHFAPPRLLGWRDSAMMESAETKLRDWGADTAIVLGSGLSDAVPFALFAEGRELAYSEFEDLPRSTVAGHPGRFSLSEIGSRPVIFAQGRVHLHEGRSALEVTSGIRLLHAVGVTRLILTNAAGSLNANFAPGSWMMLTDHLNLTGTSPLIGHGAFIDLTDCYDPALRTKFAQTAARSGMPLHEGVYASVIGPQYETPAEVRMLRGLGADVIGMSTVLETIQARALGLRVAAFSCLTNWAAGLADKPLSHAEVLEIGRRHAGEFLRLLTEAL